LTEKLGAGFEELPFPGRRQMAKTLARYAVERGVTRIVLGHSKHGRWRELRQGSIGEGLVRRIKNVDVFFVADSTEREGERILPARSRTDSPASYRRLSEQEVKQQIGTIRRGTFKVYIGAAPGVGKTYTMLREGNALRRKGIDAAIGLLETHGRKGTIAQVGELPSVPLAEIDYRGTKLAEMDVPAIIRRNPEVVLIDELAHTNVPGNKNKKRYDDVIDVLNAGISVISTMNVQHLESLNNAVEQMTGVRVRETVPDSILRLADEVELIDVDPKKLRQRMRDGNIYAAEKVEQALGGFFKTGNLIALRELALREIADDVDERLEAWERSGSLRGPWRRSESIFVAVTLSPNAQRLIRRGFRIAHRLKAQWHVVYVHPACELPEALAARAGELRELTHRLGGSFVLAAAKSQREVPSVLLQQAEAFKCTQMIIGQSARGWLHALLRKSIVRTVLRHARHMDVLVVADFEPNMRIAEE
jgi:two-component system sensor histidine kinase KdpD